MATHHLPAGDDNSLLTHHPLASTLAWRSRAGVLLNPQPVFDSNLGRYEQSQLLQPCNSEEKQENSTEVSESKSNPSVDYFLPLPELREIPPTLVPLVQRTEMPIEIGQHDTSFDQMEHHQAKEQSRLLERFKLLKQWQQQQQEKLLRQQQDQLVMLRSEQQRVHQAMLVQRQRQWGAGHVVTSPPRNLPSQLSNELPTSPQQRDPGDSGGPSSLPQAVAKGSLLLSQMVGPRVLNTLLGSQNLRLPSQLAQQVDLDTTASETNSSITEEGVYPLPETASENSDEYSQNGDVCDETRQTLAHDQDPGVDADMEEEDEYTKEFTPEENDHTPVRKSPSRRQSPKSYSSPPHHVADQYHKDNDDNAFGDERPIKPGLGRNTKTFEELIEEQMRLDQQKQGGAALSNAPRHNSSAAASPAGKFLRRGQGIARFGKVVSRRPPATKKRPRETKKAQTNAQRRSESRSQDVATSKGVQPKSEGVLSVVPPVEKALSRKVAVRQSIPDQPRIPAIIRKTRPLSRSAIDKEKLPSVSMAMATQPQTDQCLPTDGPRPDDTFEMSFNIRMQNLQKKAENEVDELEEFELLEQAADDNASFSSDASLVVNMMKRMTTRKQVSLGPLTERSVSLHSSQEQQQNLQSSYQSNKQLSDGFESDNSDDSDLDSTLKEVGYQYAPQLSSVGADHVVFSPLLSNQPVIKIGSSTEDDSDLGTFHTSGSVDDRVRQDASWRNKLWEKKSTALKHLQINSNFNNSNGAASHDSNSCDTRQRRSDEKTDDSAHSNVGDDKESRNQNDEREEEEEEEDEVKEEESEKDEEDDAQGEEEVREEKVKEEDDSKKTAAAYSHALNVDFEDEESWGDFANASLGDDSSDDDSIIASLSAVTSTPPTAIGKGLITTYHLHAELLPLDRRRADRFQVNQVADSPPTSKLVSKLFPKLQPVVSKQQRQQERQQAEAMQKATERPVGDGAQSKLLRDKLAELENEIERFRKENTTLAKLREDREKSLAALQTEINEFQKQKAEELQSLQEFKDKEMKKLRQEKKNFEKYQKAMRAMPDKRDRSEIELLKSQLQDLQEELNKRESRWQANSARLRTRVEMLEKENKELGDEVEVMRDEKRQALTKVEAKTKSKAAKIRARQLEALESARLASFASLPRVNVSSSSSEDETDRSLAPVLHNKSRKAGSVEDITIKPQMLKHSNDGDLKSRHAQKKAATGERGQSVGRNNSPSRGGRIASKEASHTRMFEEDKDDPTSQSKVQKKHSVRFDVSPSRGNSSPVRTTRPSPHQSPVKSLWNLDHPSVSGESSPDKHLDPGIADSSSKKDNQDDDDDDDAVSEQIHHLNGKVEHIAQDGSRVITFRNGTRKEISTDGQSVIVTFFNGDRKQIMPDGRVVYYYSETAATHTTYPDGLEIILFQNNQTEKHYPDGTKEITFPDHTIKYLFANGNEESVFADGTVLRVDKNGERTMEFPNGQREVHTKQFKKREYPDGSVKTVYIDGRQETRYSNGRLRIKDKDGTIILDKTC